MISGIGSSTPSPIGTRTTGTAAVARTGNGREATGALNTSARIVAEGPPIETDRVASLRAAIRAGSYRADPAAIAGRMIDGDIA